MNLTELFEIPSCCRCNGSGRCLNCACVKAGTPCSNCLPQRKGNCANCTSDSRDRHDSRLSHRATQVRQSHTLAQTLPSPPSQPMVHDSAPNVILPSFTPMEDPRFLWGRIDADSLIHSITAAYAEVVNWRRNMFAIPLGNAGKSFVNELALQV